MNLIMAAQQMASKLNYIHKNFVSMIEHEQLQSLYTTNFESLFQAEQSISSLQAKLVELQGALFVTESKTEELQSEPAYVKFKLNDPEYLSSMHKETYEDRYLVMEAGVTWLAWVAKARYPDLNFSFMNIEYQENYNASKHCDPIVLIPICLDDSTFES